MYLLIDLQSNSFMYSKIVGLVSRNVFNLVVSKASD